MFKAILFYYTLFCYISILYRVPPKKRHSKFQTKSVPYRKLMLGNAK